MNENPVTIIDQKKVDESVAVLKQIINLVMEFNKFFPTLSLVEKNIVGGLVIALHSPALDGNLSGSICTDHLAQGLTNVVNMKFQERMQAEAMKQKQQPPSIVPATLDGKKAN